MSRQARSVLTALVVVLLAAALLSPITTLPRDTPTPSVSTPSAAARPAPQPGGGKMSTSAGTKVDKADLSAVSALLQRRASAVLARDEAQFLADLGGPDFIAEQKAVFANLADVPLKAWTYELNPASVRPNVPSAATRYDGTVLTFAVDFGYQFSGFDTRPDVHKQVLTFARANGESWRLVSDTDGEELGITSWRGMWDYGPVVVRRTPTGLLLAHPGQSAALEGLAQAVEQAVPAVSSVWGTEWAEKVVVLVPASTAELRTVGQVGFDLAGLAAVATATSVDFTNGFATGQRVLINPDVLVQLGPTASLALMTHEITHVAARPATSEKTPAWLVEGFADYVGFRATGSTPTQVAQGLAAQLRAGVLPTALPVSADFEASSTTLNATYAQSWLACRYLADVLGEADFVAFYRKVAGAPSPTATLTQELEKSLGMTDAEFVTTWIAYLQDELL